MPRISTIAENAIFNINKAQARYSKSSTELTTGNRNLSRDINSSITVSQLDNKAQAIKKVREGLIYMKNMFATAHTGTQALLSNLSEQQNLIRAAGNNASDQVLAQLKTSLDLQIAAFIRTVTETNFDGKTLLNGSGAAGAGGLPAGVIAPFHVMARMRVSMFNNVPLEITCLHPSQIYTRTTMLSNAVINDPMVMPVANAGVAAANAIRIGAGIDGAEVATVALGCGPGNGSLAVIASNLDCSDAANTPKIDTPNHRRASEEAINAARETVSAQNTRIEAYLSILDDTIDSLSSDLITTNSTVSSFANTDYMQSSEEGKNALQAILAGMSVLSIFQSRMNSATLEAIKA